MSEMAHTENLLPETEQQNGAVWTFLNTSGFGDVQFVITPEAKEALVGDLMEVDMTGQTAVESIVLDPRAETGNNVEQNEKKSPAKSGIKTRKIPAETVPSIHDAIKNGTELTAPMKLAIKREKKRRLIELIDDKIHHILGLPRQSKLPTVIQDVSVKETQTEPEMAKQVKRGKSEMAKQVKRGKSKIQKGKTVKVLECLTCHHFFQNSECLFKHQQNEHPQETGTKNRLDDCEESVHQCHQCGHISTDAISLKNHIIIHSIKDFICDICGDSYVSKRGLIRHKRFTHTQNRPFQCSQCDLAFKRSKDRKAHLLTHSSERPFVCTECGSGSKRYNVFVRHMKSVHDFSIEDIPARPPRPPVKKPEPKQVTFMCDICDSSFISKSKRRHHRKITHTLNKQFKCPKCDLVFENRLDLRTHTFIHRRYGPRVCTICQTPFTQRQNLERHLRVAHGFSPEDLPPIPPRKPKERKNKTPNIPVPYICEICGRSFVSAHGLRQHHRFTHTENRPFKCAECSSAFKRAADLRSHRVTHTSEKSHVCTCGKAFKGRLYLLRHMRKAHGSSTKDFPASSSKKTIQSKKDRLDTTLSDQDKNAEGPEIPLETSLSQNLHAPKGNNKNAHSTLVASPQDVAAFDISMEELTARLIVEAGKETVNV